MIHASKRKLSLMIWECISYHGIGTIYVVDGNSNAEKYTSISVLDENLWHVILHFADAQLHF